MKKEKINIRMTKRAFYTFVILLIILGVGIGVGVYAFGTNNPSDFGHSAKELNLSDGVEGNAVFLGNVGIGVSNPTVRLEVSGDFKVGNSGVACDVSKAGAVRFNQANKTIELCDGETGWKELK